MASRVANNPINVPQGVEVKLVGQDISVKGKHGELSFLIPSTVKVAKQDQILQVSVSEETAASNALAGTTRALVSNMVHGVSTGFTCELVLVGVGYRAKAEGKKLNLTLGFSHPVDMTMPAGITVETPSQTEIVLKGADKQAVNQIGANIRALRSPEPYKGKGIRYKNEAIALKEGKKK